MSDKKKINTDSTCAGKKIGAAMHMLSADLVRGCTEFAKMTQKAGSKNEVRFYNMACILFATSAIEAKLNEWIHIAQFCFKDEPKSFWHALAPLVKNLKLAEKWNLIASHEDGTLWDKGKEPFQSFDLISSLRNELVHYKGKFLPKDEAPIKKIKALMEKLSVESQSTFIEDDCSGWVYDLLNCRELGDWVASKTIEFERRFLILLKSNT